MLPEYLNLKDIDREVREAVIRLNRLPYIVTISSCEGHVQVGVNGLIPWSLTEGLLTLQTNGSDDAKKFVGWLMGFCNEYGFVYFQKSEASTEEEINRRISDTRFRIYGFKFPLGKEEYHILTDRLEGDKLCVVDSKRRVNEFWRDLTAELVRYELSSVK